MGRAIVAGGKPAMEAPSVEIMASELAVGSTVKLMENGASVEYLVVHKGRPSTVYDTSCDGLWLLRKDIVKTSYVRDSRTNNSYNGSTIDSYLTSTFFDTLDETAQNTIKKVKIPYVNASSGSGGALASGSSGLSRKVFLLSGTEVTTSTTVTSSGSGYDDGTILSYFADNSNNKRIAKLNGTATKWWLRTPKKNDNSGVMRVGTDGVCTFELQDYEFGVRPALILPNDAVFDAKTMLLKGVA